MTHGIYRLYSWYSWEVRAANGGLLATGFSPLKKLAVADAVIIAIARGITIDAKCEQVLIFGPARGQWRVIPSDIAGEYVTRDYWP